jgi:uncharacterized protein YegP (UPF0339 family)
MNFIIFEDAPGAWRWQLVCGSGWIIAVSAESYISRTDCLYAVQVVKGAGMARICDASGLELERRPKPRAANTLFARRAA